MVRNVSADKAHFLGLMSHPLERFTGGQSKKQIKIKSTVYVHLRNVILRISKPKKNVPKLTKTKEKRKQRVNQLFELPLIGANLSPVHIPPPPVPPSLSHLS